MNWSPLQLNAAKLKGRPHGRPCFFLDIVAGPSHQKIPRPSGGFCKSTTNELFVTSVDDFLSYVRWYFLVAMQLHGGGSATL